MKELTQKVLCAIYWLMTLLEMDCPEEVQLLLYIYCFASAGSFLMYAGVTLGKN